MAYQESNIFNGLQAGTYKVRVKDATNMVVEKEVEVPYVPDPPGIPVPSLVVAKNTSIEYSWDAVLYADGYKLDLSIASDFSSFVSGYEDLDIGDFTDIILTGLTQRTIYYFRVRAYNVAGTSDSSSTVEASTVSTEYQTLVNKLETDGVTLPSNTRRVKDDALMRDLVDDGNLSASEALHILGWFNYTGALYNWATPATHKCSFVGSISSSDFLADAGYNTVALSGLNPSINPSTASPITDDIVTIWMWVDSMQSKSVYVGVNISPDDELYVGVEYGNIYSRIFSESGSPEYEMSLTGGTINFLAAKRINSTTIEYYANGSLIGTTTRSFNARGTLSPYYLVQRAGTLYIPEAGVRKFAAGVGGDIDVPALYAALSSYKASL